MSGRVLVPHQPAYLPWPGYFSRLLDLDSLLVLDHVQYAGSYQRRNIIRSHHDPIRLTVPIRHPKMRPIAEILIDDAQPWAARHWRAISDNYRRARFWSVYADRLEAVYNTAWTHLCELNLAMTALLADAIGLEVRFEQSSALAPSGRKTLMLIDLCRAAGADTLRLGTGAAAYLDHAALADHGITLQVAAYQPRSYGPERGFHPELSALDLILHEGPRARAIMAEGASITTLQPRALAATR